MTRSVDVKWNAAFWSVAVSELLGLISGVQGLWSVDNPSNLFIALIRGPWCIAISSSRPLLRWKVDIRVGQGPQTFSGTHGNQLPSLVTLRSSWFQGFSL